MPVSFLVSADRHEFFRSGASRLLQWGAALLIGSSVGVLGGTSRSMAAEKLVLTFGPLGDSIEIAELKNFVETGDIPRSLRPYLQLTKADPDVVRAIFRKEARVGLRFLDRALNTLPGEYGLFQLGTLVHTPPRVANIQALRAAVILSVSDDNQISLLEFLENYPTPTVVIDGVALLRVAQVVGRVTAQVADRVAEIERRLDAWIAVGRDLLENLVCECPPPTGTAAPKSEPKSEQRIEQKSEQLIDRQSMEPSLPWGHKTIPSERIFRSSGEFSVSKRDRGMKRREISRLCSRHS